MFEALLAIIGRVHPRPLQASVTALLAASIVKDDKAHAALLASVVDTLSEDYKSDKEMQKLLADLGPKKSTKKASKKKGA